jgi:pimeloyl-ACP methyl ester carboxylesterase
MGTLSIGRPGNPAAPRKSARQRVAWWLRTVALAAVTGYAATCVALWGGQAHLIFEPESDLRTSPRDYPFAIQDVAIPMPGAQSPQDVLHGWWIPSRSSGAKAVLFLHGNEGNVSTNMERVEGLRQLGYSVLIIDYRGYGRSGGGFPDEAGVYRDAQAAWDHVVRDRHVAPSDVLIYGHSLGAAIAIELATHHPEALGLVVESGFTSIEDMAALDERYAILPVSLMLDQRFDSIRKVGRLALPVLFVHGTADKVVPFEMGRALYEATPAAAGFVAVPGAGHDDNAVRGGAMLRAELEGFVGQASARRNSRTVASLAQ